MLLIPANWPAPASPPKENTPWFSRKNSRFSGKKSENRVRLICCSSASTWAKSVFTVRSATRLSVTPYFTSSPISPVAILESRGAAVRTPFSSAMAYGFSSRLMPASGTSRPTRVAACEICMMAP